MDIIVHRLYKKLLDGVSASSNHLSDALDIQSFSLYCVQYSWSGFSAVNPLIKIYASNNLSEPFVEIDSYVPAGTTGGRIVNVEKAGYALIKIGYSCSSGAGIITASVNGKVL